MLLRSSISKTRKLFHKTLENFKSLFTNGYQKLPKPPVCKPCNSCIKNNNPKQNYRVFNAIQEGNGEKSHIRNRKIRSFCDQDCCFIAKKPQERVTEGNFRQCDEIQEGNSEETRIQNGKIRSFCDQDSRFTAKKPRERETEGCYADIKGNFRQFHEIQEGNREKTRIHNGKIRSFRDQDSSFIYEKARESERKRFPVTEKLKELETVMDMRNSDHVIDIQEFLHYYSRLNSPAYLDIVDDFFQEMCNELLEPVEPPRRAVSSRPNAAGSYRGQKNMVLMKS